MSIILDFTCLAMTKGSIVPCHRVPRPWTSNSCNPNGICRLYASKSSPSRRSLRKPLVKERAARSRDARRPSAPERMAGPRRTHDGQCIPFNRRAPVATLGLRCPSGYHATRHLCACTPLCLNFVSAISSFGGIVSFVFFPCLLRLLRFLFLVLLRLLVLVLRTGAPARVGGCKSVLERGSWSTPLVVRSFVVSSMMKLRHRTVFHT